MVFEESYKKVLTELREDASGRKTGSVIKSLAA
jgi:hypothetical protein